MCQSIGEAKTGHGIMHGRCRLAQQRGEPGLIALEQDEGFRIVFQQQPGQLVQQGRQFGGGCLRQAGGGRGR